MHLQGIFARSNFRLQEKAIYSCRKQFRSRNYHVRSREVCLVVKKFECKRRADRYFQLRRVHVEQCFSYVEHDCFFNVPNGRILIFAFVRYEKKKEFSIKPVFVGCMRLKSSKLEQHHSLLQIRICMKSPPPTLVDNGLCSTLYRHSMEKMTQKHGGFFVHFRWLLHV